MNTVLKLLEKKKREMIGEVRIWKKENGKKIV